MITRDTFPELLEYLGFTKSKSLFRKTIGEATLIVEIVNQEIQYPEAIPPLAEQKRLVAEVEKLEQAIATAQNVLAAAVRKQAVMQRYL